MFDSFLDIAGTVLSVGSGGITGLIASGFSAWFKSREKKADREWELVVMEKQTSLNINLADSQGRWEGLAASIQADASTNKNIHKIVSDIKALFRPALTIGLWVMAAWIFKELLTPGTSEDSQLAGVLSGSELKDLIRYMVYTTFFTAATSASWWFGDRALTLPELK